MTGFGVGEALLGGGKLVLELRSLNHRYLDIRVRMPPELVDQSFWLEQLARERLTRGRFDLGVRLEGAALPEPRLALERARTVYRALGELRDELAPGSELPIGALAALPELIVAPVGLDVELARKGLASAFERAIGDLEKMLQREGAALKSELKQRISAARRLWGEVQARAGELVEMYRMRLRERLDRLLRDAGAALDGFRLETEVAIMADRSDVTEELVRLSSHFDEFERLLETDDAVGRRLDFLLQEIGRETNTVGSKSQDAPIAHLVVELKAEIERMREQVQNVR